VGGGVPDLANMGGGRRGLCLLLDLIFFALAIYLLALGSLLASGSLLAALLSTKRAPVMALCALFDSLTPTPDSP
jgi:hypothetical protein